MSHYGFSRLRARFWLRNNRHLKNERISFLYHKRKTYLNSPASLSRREWTTLRKNKSPDGRNIWWADPWILTISPSLYHSILGFGEPSALQFSVTGSCLGTVASRGCSMILGGSRPAKRKVWRRFIRKLWKSFLPLVVRQKSMKFIWQIKIREEVQERKTFKKLLPFVGKNTKKGKKHLLDGNFMYELRYLLA